MTSREARLQKRLDAAEAEFATLTHALKERGLDWDDVDRCDFKRRLIQDLKEQFAAPPDPTCAMDRPSYAVPIIIVTPDELARM